MKKVKGFGFGYDLVEVNKVQNYVENNFVEGEDFEMFFGMGDDVMNWLEVRSEDLLEDEKFIKLVKECDGGGEFEE
jgi:hypothetical protein